MIKISVDWPREGEDLSPEANESLKQLEQKLTEYYAQIIAQQQTRKRELIGRIQRCQQHLQKLKDHGKNTLLLSESLSRYPFKDKVFRPTFVPSVAVFKPKEISNELLEPPAMLQEWKLSLDSSLFEPITQNIDAVEDDPLPTEIPLEPVENVITFADKQQKIGPVLQDATFSLYDSNLPGLEAYTLETLMTTPAADLSPIAIPVEAVIEVPQVLGLANVAPLIPIQSQTTQQEVRNISFPVSTSITVVPPPPPQPSIVTPPPPPPPQTPEIKSISVKMPDTADRGSLLDSIRMSGGLKALKPVSSRPKISAPLVKPRTQSKRSIKQQTDTEADSGGDMMSALASALALRRKKMTEQQLAELGIQQLKSASSQSSDNEEWH